MIALGHGPELARAANVMIGDYLAIKADDQVVITADTSTDMGAVEAILNATEGAGAKSAVVLIPQLPFQGSLADPYIPETFASAVKSCDAWIDLCFPYTAGSTIHDQTMKAKRAKYFLGGDMGAGGLARMFGKADMDQLFKVQQAFDAVVADNMNNEWRATSPLGTDIRFRLGDSVKRRPRRADRPGMYGAPGSAVLYTDPDSVHGVVVAEAVFHEYFTVLSKPMTIKLEGKITEVSGGGSERQVMDRALRRAGGGEYGSVIHLTYGFNPGARLGGSLTEATRVPGCNAVGLGRPFWEPGGGENHPDAIVTMQSLYANGQQIVKDGILVGPPELAALGRELEPTYQ